MALAAVLLQYRWIILFYLALALFLVLRRRRLAVQSKIILLYRTTIGIRLMDRLAGKYREWVKLFGYVGIGIGFVGLVLISALLLIGFAQLFTRPEQPASVSLVLPGVEVPGLGVLPFWHWLIAIFVIAVVHEFGHGIVARAHGIGINWTGLVLIGPIIGAFVEPDEKRLAKERDVVQYSVYAAGAVANIFLGIIAVLLMLLVALPLQQSLVEPVGFAFDGYYGSGYPAERAGLRAGEVITAVNGEGNVGAQRFSEIIGRMRPNETLEVRTAGNATLLMTAASHPDDTQRAFIGIVGIRGEYRAKQERFAAMNRVLLTLIVFLRWLFVLSLGIGLFNVLPLPIVDGGRMAQTFLRKAWGEHRGNKAFGTVSFFFLLVLALSLLVPMIRSLLQYLQA